MISKDDITVVILAGGQGSRMGGQDKGLIEYQQRPLIHRILEALTSQTDRIVINANRNQGIYASYGFPVIEDTYSGFQGPLAGFYAAMTEVKTDYILTLPCDGKVVIDNYLSIMVQAMNDSGCDIAVASDGVRLQPVYALIPVRLQHSLQQFLDAGDRKIDLWSQQHNMSAVEFTAEDDLFANINSPKDLA